MNINKFLIATLAGAVATFFAGFLIYGLALKNYMASNTLEGVGIDPPNFIYLALGNIVFAALVTYIFMKWAGISTLGSGAQAGLIIGLLFNLGIAFFFLGMSKMYTGGIVTALVDTVASGIIWAIGGAVVGWVLGSGKK